MGLQGHIHLSETLSGIPEYAPDLTWVVTNRVEIPMVFMTLQRSLTGKLYKHQLTNANGPVQLSNFAYTVKVKADDFYSLEERVALLKAMNGKAVYLCDNFHADDGTDHTADVKPMICAVSEFAPVGVGLPFFLVEIQLEDNSL